MEVEDYMGIPMKFKICLLGDYFVGKTSLIRRYVKNEFDEKYVMTIGTRTSKKDIVIKKPGIKDDFEITFIIWDIMGQYSTRKLLHPTYLQGADGAILVSDLTRRITLDHLDNWIDSVYSVRRVIPIVFIGNKSDLTDELEFGKSELDSMASNYDSPFFTASAKTGANVEDAFRSLGEKIISDIVARDPSFRK
ncbi:MAG: GTP-binding protein [Thermoplasmata archaeon]|nr:MAG: GTP-binding protein [Thermoplasmata archaeon]